MEACIQIIRIRCQREHQISISFIDFTSLFTYAQLPQINEQFASHDHPLNNSMTGIHPLQKVYSYMKP